MLEKPPTINKDDILNSLTDPDSDDDWTEVNGIETLTDNEQNDGMKMYS